MDKDKTVVETPKIRKSLHKAGPKGFFAVLVFSVVIFSCTGAFADIYKWVDENGKLHITDAKHEDRENGAKGGGRQGEGPTSAPADDIKRRLDAIVHDSQGAGGLSEYSVESLLLEAEALESEIRNSGIEESGRKKYLEAVLECEKALKKRKKALLEKRKNEEERQRREKEKEREEAKKKEDFSMRLTEAVQSKLDERGRNKLSTKVQYIRDGRPVYMDLGDMLKPLGYGMTEDEVRNVWGEPERVVVHNYSNGTCKWWYYPMRIHLYFGIEGRLSNWSSY